MTDAKVDDACECVLFIGHDASRTGAPNSLLKIIDWVSRNTHYEPLTILARGGALTERYAEISETYVWEADQQYLLSRYNSSNISMAVARIGLSELAAKLNRKQIVSRVRRAQPVCVFSNTGVTGDLLRNFSPYHHAPVVSRIPELEAYMRRNLRSGGLRTVLANSDHFIAVSHAVRRNLEERHSVPGERISVVYGACDAHTDYPKEGSLRGRLGLDGREFLVCGCGSMDWRKGFDLFLQTAYRVCCVEGRKDIRFLWAGGPITQEAFIEYSYEVEMLGLSSSLTLLGEHENPSELFAQCDLFFLSSREDPFPLVMLEAARQGLPILCFQGSGGATEFVQPTFGTVLPMLDTVKAAQEVIRRADDVQTQGEGRAARDRALEFSVERMGAEVAAIITKLASRAAIDRRTGTH